MKLIESDLECPACGEKMALLVSGIDNERGSYVCPNADFTYQCKANVFRQISSALI